MFFIFHNVGKELIKDSKFTDCGSLVSTELQSQTLSELRLLPTHKNKIPVNHIMQLGYDAHTVLDFTSCFKPQGTISHDNLKFSVRNQSQ